MWESYEKYTNVVNTGFSSKEGINSDEVKVPGRGFPEPIIVSPCQYEIIGN